MRRGKGDEADGSAAHKVDRGQNAAKLGLGTSPRKRGGLYRP